MTSNLPVMLARNFLGVVRANYEDDDSSSPSPTSPTSSSVPASPSTTTPTSSLPNAVSSFFSGQPTTTSSSIPQFHRRASESGPADSPVAEPKRLLARRYTLPPRMDPLVRFGALQAEDTGNRVPMARFWEAGGKEDSSVQLAMEHVQFGF